ncbi:hypothetical protein V496_04668 [Pseudogymnoascus sp. VKM F-4515 (FW-2607)]|nr:hypothetical protein V496_04668 [Pseudogymnoascus sp. VKM F-4515 (FW-2607)]
MRRVARCTLMPDGARTPIIVLIATRTAITCFIPLVLTRLLAIAFTIAVRHKSSIQILSSLTEDGIWS